VRARSRIGLALGLAAAVWPVALASQAAATGAVIDRTTGYVQSFIDRFANVVAEERYVQSADPAYTRGERHRVLISDFLLVQPQGSTLYYQFRDVREVDGQAVPDRDRRLTELFLQPWATAISQAARIAADGARHNIVNVGTINYPLQAMIVLQPRYRDRIELSVGGRERVAGRDLRALTFRERNRQDASFIFGSVRASGQAWVDETTGMVMKTEIEFRRPGARFAHRVTTAFVEDAQLSLAVPAEMRDSYYAPAMTGVATYGRFRTFQVRTAEEIQP
jgi:hypothetical protein